MDRDKKNFHKEQAEKFLDFTKKSPERDFLSLFEEWAGSKDFSEEDRQNIFAKFLSQLTRKFLDKNYGQ